LRILKAAAYANCDLGVLPIEKRDAIAAVCDEILAGKLEDEFPLVIWQTGSGTQSNMNVNEVVEPCSSIKRICYWRRRAPLKPMMMSTSHNHQTIHSLLNAHCCLQSSKRTIP
jgi:fumarate hydratase class II